MKTDTKKQSDVRSVRWEDMMMMMMTSELWMMKTLPEEEDCASISHQRALLSLETAPCEGQKPPLLFSLTTADADIYNSGSNPSNFRNLFGLFSFIFVLMTDKCYTLTSVVGEIS